MAESNIAVLRARIGEVILQSAANRFSTSPLTQREQQVLALVCQGRTNREIATELSVGEDCIRRHLSHVFDKTGAGTRLELTVFCLRNVVEVAQ